MKNRLNIFVVQLIYLFKGGQANGNNKTFAGFFSFNYYTTYYMHGALGYGAKKE